MRAQRILIPLVVAAAFGAALALPARAPAQGRADCTEVVRAMHGSAGRTGPRKPDSIKIAKKLGVDAEWVERCAETYGRRIKRREDPDHPRVEGDSNLAEQHEAEEYDEVSREEKETEGDTYVTVIENDVQDRKKLGQVRNEDMFEWEPDETHEWKPDIGRPWKPVLHDDEED